LAYNAERVVAEKLGRETVTYCQQHTSSTWRDLERAFRTKGVCAGHASDARPYRHVGVCSQRRSGGVKERV